MASLSLTVTKVLQAGGKVYIRWSDGVEMEFAGLQPAKDFVADLVTDKTYLRKLALARYLFIDPTGSTPSLIEGHSITVRNDNNAMVVVV